MSEQNPYEKLGVNEGASFEEIQSSRSRLLEEHAGNPQKQAELEKAYDAVLMERLKQRQEGKIKVPDGIRFAEKTPQPATTPTLTLPKPEAPAWLQTWVGQPDLWNLLVPAIVLVGLSVWIGWMPRSDVLQLTMAFATGTSLFFLYRKEHKLGRAVLLSFVSSILGFLLGLAIYALLPASIRVSLPAGEMGQNLVISWVVFLVLWIVTVFFK
ncbi:MAG: CPP1-like family protein [Synechococcales bacterium]|nr:CPP1-like family protein [Synechococcales bacterium]